ncbi:hypothetical protein BH10PSE7_BH10PSE7_03270 [soil metagenome]
MNGKIIALALLAAASFNIGSAEARRNEFKIRNIVWTCAGRYVAAPRPVRIDTETGAMTCLGRGERGRRALTRGEANLACRDQFHTFSRLVAKTSGGWQCRYYPQ